MNTLRSLPHALPLLFAVFAAAITPAWADNVHLDRHSTTQPGGLRSAQAPVPALSRQSAAYIRALAATALARVAAARVDLHGNHAARALRHLGDARLLIDLIRAARPSAEADGLVHYLRAHQTLEDNEQLLADLMPVGAALRALPRSTMRNRSLHEFASVRRDLQMSASASAHHALDTLAQDLTMDGIDFPLHAAADALQQAMHHLTSGDGELKDTALVPVEKNLLRVIRHTHAGNTPRSS